MYQGLIDYKLGIPLFIANIIVGWIVASLILKFEAKWTKIIMMPVSLVPGIKLIFF